MSKSKDKSQGNAAEKEKGNSVKTEADGETIEIASAEEIAAYAGNQKPQDSDVKQQEAQEASVGDGAAEVEAAPDWKDKFLRAKAEFQNFQKRSAEEMRTTQRYANADFARQLLEVVDDFERTLENEQRDAANQSAAEGVRLIYEKLLKVLRDHHVECIEATGKSFDPNCHEAMMQQPSDEYAPGTVMQELQKGYRLHDRVIRPTRVIVVQSLNDNQDAECASDQNRSDEQAPASE